MGNSSLIPHPDDALIIAGQVANDYAARGALADYLARKSAK